MKFLTPRFGIATLLAMTALLHAAPGASTNTASRPRPAFGLWYTVWWTSDDQFRHWTNCHRLPKGGRYTSGDPAIIASHYKQFRDMGIDFLIMDDTNGVGNDGGRINENIRAWFEFMDAKPASNRIPICIGGGGEMRAAGAAGQKQAADFYWASWAQRPSYFKIEGRPLLLVDTDKNYGPGDFDDSRFSVRWAYNGDNFKAMEKNKAWGWGAYAPAPQLKECMSIWPGHRFPGNVAKLGRDPLEAPRLGGELYASELLRALEFGPQNIVIADWNNFEEETAIEDSFSWEDKSGYAVPDLYRRITKAYSRLRDQELVAGEYYRAKGKAGAFQYNGKALVPVTEPIKGGIALEVPEAVLRGRGMTR